MQSSRSIAQAIIQHRDKGKIALVPFIPAGYPDLETTAALLPALEAAGAAVIEIGIPFSDPIADGPTIQEAFTAALAKKIKVADVLRTVAGVRGKIGIPLAAMVSYSIVFRYGVEKFVKDCKAAGFDGLIIPDLPPPEAQRICDVVRAGGLDTVLLVAPTTAVDRRPEICRLSSGFVYYLSVSGITGERDKLPTDITANVRQLKGLGNTPVCVGFGISRREHLEQLAGVADGAIVGSAFVKRMKGHLNDGPVALANILETYAAELLGRG